MLWRGYKKAMTNLKWRWVRLLPFLCVVVPAWADVPAYPPQNVPSIQRLSTAPNGQTFRNVGSAGSTFLDMESKTLTYTPNQFGTVKPSSGSLVGTKTNPVNLTDNYGNVARGQIQTQTAMPANSRIAQGLGSIYVLQIANQHLTNLKAQGVSEMYSRGFENGDWGMVADATARLFDWTGFGGNVRDSIWGNPDMQQIQQQLHQQALQQAQQQFNQYQATPRGEQLNPADYNDYALVRIREWGVNQPTLEREILVNKADYSQYKYWRIGNLLQSTNKDLTLPFRLGAVEIYPQLPISSSNWINMTSVQATAQDIRNHNLQNLPQMSEIVPKEAEVARLLEQILNDNNRNHTELINALWQAGVIGPGNTQSMVMGSPADNTFLTQPFTPAGSNQAQQTQFIVNNNGTITQNTIQRPDLAANTSQAPTRAEVGNQQQQGQQDTRPAKSDSTAEKPDVCAQNPNSLMCAPVGGADYTDPVIPTQNVDMSFNPANIFSTDGVCPQPRKVQFQLGSSSVNWEFSYSTVCDFSRHIRPLIIMCAMFMAATICYGAVKRL